MRDRALDVLAVEPLVEADRRVNLRHQRCRVGVEMPAPESAPARGPFRHHPLHLPPGARMRRTLRSLAVIGLLAANRAAGADAPIETTAPEPLPALAFQTMDGQETT